MIFDENGNRLGSQEWFENILYKLGVKEYCIRGENSSVYIIVNEKDLSKVKDEFLKDKNRIIGLDIIIKPFKFLKDVKTKIKIESDEK